MFSPQKLMSWSSADSASRMQPSAPRAMANSAPSSIVTFSSPQIYLRCPAMRFTGMRRRSKRWQRDMIVGSTFSGLGGGEHELHVRRRLLERLEQRVERRRGEHVHLVDDVDLELRRGRRVHTGLAQLTHLIDAVVAGAVDLQHVDRAALGDLVALRIVIGKIDLRPVGAVEALGKNPRQGRLAGSPWPAEQIGVRDSLTTDGVGQRLADVILADDIAEALRTVFPGYDLVRHRR